MKKFWSDHAWLIALAVLSLVVAVALWGRPVFCGSGSEQCFREWVSATGGWAALIVAFVTLDALREQIGIASRQADAASRANTNSARIQLRRGIALAMRVKRDCRKLDTVATRLAHTWHRDAPYQVTRNDYVVGLNSLLKEIDAAYFAKFESEIAVSSSTVDEIKRQVESLLDTVRGLPDEILSGGEEASLKIKMNIAVQLAKSHIESCTQTADEFIDEAEEMIALG